MTDNVNLVREIDKIVILGAGGFIGAQLAGFLERNHPDLQIIRFSSRTLDLVEESSAGRLASVFDSHTALVICSGIKKQLGDNLRNFSLNMRMIENICAVLEKHPVKRIVYISSAEVYGEEGRNTPIEEETPEQPASFYGIAKSAAERLLKRTVGSGGDSSLLILRPPLVYGAGDRSRGYGPSGFCWKAIAGEKVSVWGDGSELREFVFIDDLVDAVCRLMFHGFAGTVTIATGTSHSFRETLETIESLVREELAVEHRPRTMAKTNIFFSNRLLLELLPDFSFTSLHGGIAATLREVRRLSGKLNDTTVTL